MAKKTIILKVCGYCCYEDINQTFDEGRLALSDFVKLIRESDEEWYVYTGIEDELQGTLITLDADLPEAAFKQLYREITTDTDGAFESFHWVEVQEDIEV